MTRYLMHDLCWKKIDEPKADERGISRPMACCAVCGCQGVYGGVLVKERHMPKKLLKSMKKERERYWKVRCG